MAARSSCQLPLTRHITRDCDGLWKDIRRTERAPKRHNLPVGGPLSTLPGLVVTASSGSLGHQSRDASSRPTSTILPSPDTIDGHPFYDLFMGLGAFMHQSASGVDFPSPQAAHGQFDWAVTASTVSSRASISFDLRFNIQSRAVACICVAHGWRHLSAFMPGYCPHLWTLGLYTRDEDVARGSHRTYVYSGLRATARSKGLKQSRGDKWRLEEKWAIFFKDQNTEYKYMTADYILGGRVQGFTCASAYTAGTSKTRGRNTTGWHEIVTPMDRALVSLVVFPTPPHTVYSAQSQRSARAKRWNRKTGDFRERLTGRYGLAPGSESGITVLSPSASSSIVVVVGEQQEGGMSMSGQDIFLLSPSRFPWHDCAFVHAMRTSLDVHMSTRKPSTRHPSSESVSEVTKVVDVSALATCDDVAVSTRWLIRRGILGDVYLFRNVSLRRMGLPLQHSKNAVKSFNMQLSPPMIFTVSDII
ncbi:hypothetical protein EDB84DRAFT_1443459 [Lactarius hengduanensis]|nr:hypothetical protein EDB84DRAFT_1443459 [Lactarius hengduanensis]